MKSINRETLRIRIYSYYEKYKHLGKKFTFDHFISEGEKRTTIYDIINRFESGKNAKHQSGGGRPEKNFNKQAKLKLKRLVNNKDGVYTRRNFVFGSLCHPVGFHSHSSWQVGMRLISLST